MTSEIVIGVVSLVIGIVLLFLAVPDVSGEPARFITASPHVAIIYPAFPLLFLLFGAVAFTAALT